MASLIPINLREGEFGPEFVGSIKSIDGEVHLRPRRFQLISISRIIFSSLGRDVYKKNISIDWILEVGNIGASIMVVFNSMLPLE
jgi:hypothetical protein